MTLGAPEDVLGLEVADERTEGSVGSSVVEEVLVLE